MRRTVFWVLIAVWSGSTHAAPQRLYLDNATDLAGAGVRIRPFKTFQLSPTPPPHAYRFENPVGHGDVEYYDLRELWLSAQNRITFAGPSGSITIMTLTHNVIEKVPLVNNRFVTRTDFQQAAASVQRWTRDNITKWVAYAAGLTETSSLRPAKAPQTDYPSRAYGVTAADGEWRRFYVVQFAKKHRIAVSVEFHDPRTIKNPAETVGRMLRSIRPLSPQSRDLAVTPATGYQNRRTRPDPTERGAEHAAARARIRNTIRNAEDWWFVETQHYLITSNLRAESRDLVKQIQRRVEANRRAYEQILPAAAPVTEVSVIRIFNKRSEYRNYVGPALSWTSGVWMPSRKELVVSPGAERPDGREGDSLLAVIYHEGFHQYAYYATGRRSLPVWFDEGHACLFEAAAPSGKRTVTIKENPHRMAVLKHLLDHPDTIDLASLLRMEHSDFYQQHSRDEPRAQTVRIANYATAWALVYFLRKGAVLYGDRPYRDLCDRVADATPPVDGTSEWLRPEAMPTLTHDFLDFWHSSGKRGRAERNYLFR